MTLKIVFDLYQIDYSPKYNVEFYANKTGNKRRTNIYQQNKKAVTIEFQRRRLYNIYNKNKAGEQTDNV